MKAILLRPAVLGIVPVFVSLLMMIGCAKQFEAVWAIRQTAVVAAATPSAPSTLPTPIPTETIAPTATAHPSPTPEISPTPGNTSTAIDPTVTISPEATTTGTIVVYPSGATPVVLAVRTPTPGPEATVTVTATVTRIRGPVGLTPSPRYEPIALEYDALLEEKISGHLGEDISRYGIVVKRIPDGRGVAINPDKVFYAASIFKLWVMYEVFKQRELELLTFDETVTLVPFHLEYQLGDLAWPLWTEVPIGNLVEAMIALSDNVAAIMLHDKVGGWNINQDLEAIGMENTGLVRGDLPTTAQDTALLLEMLATGRAVNQMASQDMVDLMTRQRVRNRLPALLPPGTQVAHKTGNWPSATHDVGIVYAPSAPYVIAVMSDKAWEVQQIAELSRLVYDHFEEEKPATDEEP